MKSKAPERKTYKAGAKRPLTYGCRLDGRDRPSAVRTLKPMFGASPIAPPTPTPTAVAPGPLAMTCRLLRRVASGGAGRLSSQPHVLRLEERDVSCAGDNESWTSCGLGTETGKELLCRRACFCGPASGC